MRHRSDEAQKGLRTSAVLAAALALLAPMSEARAERSTPEYRSTQPGRAEALTADAQHLYEDGDFHGAARSWSAILDVLPEGPANRAARDNALIVSLIAYEDAYEHRRGPGDASPREAVPILREAVSVLDAYVIQLRATYGRKTRLSPAAASVATRVRGLLASAIPPPPPQPDPEPADVGSIVFPPDQDVPRRKSGRGLIAGGAALIATGVAASSMIIVGSLQRKPARKERDAAEREMKSAAAIDANHKLRTANGLVIGGSVATAVLIGTGAALLGVGLARHKRYIAFQPTAGPRYAGATLRMRF